MIVTYDPSSVQLTIGGQTIDVGKTWSWANYAAAYAMTKSYAASEIRYASLVTLPTPRGHGRWVVVHPEGHGYRYSSLSRARRYARRIGGRVRRYHARDWLPPEGLPTWNVTFVTTREDGVGEDLWRDVSGK